MPEVVIRNNNVTVYVTQPSTTETVYVLQGPTGSQGPAGVVQSVVAGSNVTVDATDPANPVVSSAAGGVTDHGLLTGRGDDDHPQYHTDARGDARYYTKAQVDTSLAGKSDTSHSHTQYMERETSARTVYVATTGNDTTGDGTSGNPWRTIQHAIDQVKYLLYPTTGLTAYTVTISPGTYVEDVTVPPTAFGAFGETGGGGVVLKSSTGVASDVTIRDASDGYGVNVWGPCSLEYLTIESDDIGVLVRGGAHVQAVIDNCVIRRTSASNGGTAAIYAQLACVLSRLTTSTAGRLFDKGLYAYAGGVIAKVNSTQPTGVTANEQMAAGGTIR